KNGRRLAVPAEAPWKQLAGANGKCSFAVRNECTVRQDGDLGGRKLLRSAAACESFRMEDGVHFRRGRRAGKAQAKQLRRLAPAVEARAMPGSKGGRLVEKEKLGPARAAGRRVPAHRLAADALRMFERTDDPGFRRPSPAKQRAVFG